MKQKNRYSNKRSKSLQGLQGENPLSCLVPEKGGTREGRGTLRSKVMKGAES